MFSKTTNISLYGKGVFTTIAFSDVGPVFWEKHWSRLISDAGRLDIDISSHSEEAVKQSVLKAIDESEWSAGRVRVTFVDGSPSGLWGEDVDAAASLIIVIGERRSVQDDFRLGVSPYLVNSTSPLAGSKSCNYLEPLMSHGEAKRRGFDEAIRLNERGEVTSACMANVFWLKGDRLFTPGLTTGCMAGTTRGYVLENIECEEVEAGIEVLREAEEIFLTSAGIGVVQVAEFDGKSMKRCSHPISNLLPFIES